MFVTFALAGCVLTGTARAAAPSPAPTPASLADRLARLLAEDPIQVTDHAPRALPYDAHERIRAAVARLGVPAYVVVTPNSMATSPRHRELIASLHDRLGKDGMYIVTDPSGFGTARQFGGTLPADRAWTAASLQKGRDEGAVEQIARFVDIVSAPDVQRRIEQARERAREDRSSDGPSRSDIRDRKEMAAFAAGTALTGVPLLVLLLRRGSRRNPARAARR
ncbi:hypothetical protein GCM10022214_82840 [Actinomadura miaoliensis]|uniref:TPM domain-containing protein n=1 Tax=Actinomadura miaoliensis TaxID=430685 RepID=A0ABP7X4A2_9ACTN